MKENIVRRYIKFKAAQGRTTIEEAARRSLAHAFMVLNDPERSIAIISASRHENEEVQPGLNAYLTQQLSFKIRELKYGYFPVLGVWHEEKIDPQGQPTGEKVCVEEDSFFVNAGQQAPRRFHQNILNLVEEFNPDAAIIKYAGEDDARYLWRDGIDEIAGRFTIDKLADYYTQMKKGPPNRQFTFEAAASLSNMTRLAMKRFEEGAERYQRNLDDWSLVPIGPLKNIEE